MTFYRSFEQWFDEFLERRMEWVMLWPLIIYSIVIYANPNMFSQYRHYEYLREALNPTGWQMAFLTIASMRIVSLSAKMFWCWPYYSPFALMASIGAATLWSQFTLSFFISYLVNGTTPGPIAAHSTLVIIECLNIAHSAKGVGQLVKKGTG